MAQNGTKGYMTDHEGNPSSGRMMSAAAFVVGTIFAATDVFGWGDTSTNNFELVMVYLSMAFGAKTIQSFVERSKPTA